MSGERGRHYAPGEPERAMAHYQAKGNLHLANTRDQAAENAVQTWARLTQEHHLRQVALIADASNKEIDRLNARAQHLRAERGELGPRETYLTATPTTPSAKATTSHSSHNLALDIER